MISLNLKLGFKHLHSSKFDLGVQCRLELVARYSIYIYSASVFTAEATGLLGLDFKYKDVLQPTTS